ncbi:hypothetical protein [Euzebya sp.]|uniref:hypothetical protein n=1 Tax=Euzebya sp. TaxID=1971409 RepID=UPI0035182EED
MEGEDRTRWVRLCSIPFWALLVGAIGVAVTEDPSPVRFVATVAGGLGMSAVLLGLVLGVSASNRRALERAPTAAVEGQIRALTVIAGVALVVASGAGVAIAAGMRGGAVALCTTGVGVALACGVAIWRRARPRARRRARRRV